MILDRILQGAVDVNGLVIPGRSIEAVLARPAMSLVAYNEDATYRVTLAASATAIRFRQRELLLVTQHQLKNIDESKVGMLTSADGHLVTSQGYRAHRPHPDTDAFDIAAFDFTEPCRHWPESRNRFFDLRMNRPDVPSDQVVAVLIAGYPSSLQNYDLEEKNHLGLVRRQIVCLPDGQPADPALLSLRVQQPLDHSPDGMSGGPAFVIQLEQGRPRAYFAGLIVRGGTEYFHILKATYVTAFLESVFPVP